MGIGAIMSLFHISEEPAAGLFVGIWLVGSSYLIWFARRLRVVSIDERTLFVSDRAGGDSDSVFKCGASEREFLG